MPEWLWTVAQWGGGTLTPPFLVGGVIRPRLHLAVLPVENAYRSAIPVDPLPMFRVAVENYGLTPAWSCQVWLDSVVALQESGEDFPLITAASPLLWTDSHVSSAITIPPRSTVRANLCYIDPARPVELFLCSEEGQNFMGGLHPALLRMELSAHATLASPGRATVYLSHGGSDEWHARLRGGGLGTEVLFQLPRTRWRI